MTQIQNAERFGRDPNTGLPTDELERTFEVEIQRRDHEDTELAARAKAAMEDTGRTHDEPMRGMFGDLPALATFLEAGRAIITVRSKATGNRRTFKFSRPTEDRSTGQARPIWVNLLAGPDNGSDYVFIGTIWPNPGQWTFKRSRKLTSANVAANGAIAVVEWLVKHINTSPEALFRQAELWHEGRCGRCGRRLTVPESIASGFGPECINHV